MSAASNKAGSKGPKKSNEEVFAGFQTLRAEQRQLASKISELEQDLNEHKIVAETLRGVEGTRRCFRMVGGVLVERSVADVLPELDANLKNLPQAIAVLSEQLTKKGQLINDYIEEHDIRVQKGEAPNTPAAAAPDSNTKTNVLVASS